VILVDSGPLVAAGSANDPHHQMCTELLGSATEDLLVPATVSAEVCYMLETRAGTRSEAAFLRLFSVGKLVPVDVTTADYERMAELVEQYADFPLGGTDASLIAIAERLEVTKVATLDRRHFGSIRPGHTDAFTLLPETL
jgi:predicted nucleic acid-binding protein